MQITLFGGSFDPAQKAHRCIPQAVLTQKLADQVWYVPTKNHPFAKNLSPASDRLGMLEALLRATHRLQPALLSQLKIERYELDHPGISYSYHTLVALQDHYPQYTFSWLIGSDLLASFAKWDHYQTLLEQFPVLVYPRQGFPPEPLLPGMKLLQDVEPFAISSTQVRERVARGEDISELVDWEVERYIRENHLYAVNTSSA